MYRCMSCQQCPWTPCCSMFVWPNPWLACHCSTSALPNQTYCTEQYMVASTVCKNNLELRGVDKALYCGYFVLSINKLPAPNQESKIQSFVTDTWSWIPVTGCSNSAAIASWLNFLVFCKCRFTAEIRCARRVAWGSEHRVERPRNVLSRICCICKCQSVLLGRNTL